MSLRDGGPPECRICLLSDPLEDLVSPCHCSGSLAVAHLACLEVRARQRQRRVFWGRVKP